MIDEVEMLKARMKLLEVALHRIVELVDDVDAETEEATLLEIATTAEAALNL